MIHPDLYDELELFLGCEELSRKTSLLDMSSFDMNSILQGCRLHCVHKIRNNPYLEKNIKDVALPKYERTDTCFTLINEREESSQASSIVSKPGYAVEIPFMPLPPKEKKKRRSKRREEKVSSPRYVSPKAVAYDSELDDEPMPITYISDHDWEKHTTFDIENLFGVDYENDDCYTISTIHVSSNYDIESSKLGDEVFENPFATNDYIFEISPSSKNDDMFTNEHTLEDDYSIAYDDSMPPVFDSYYNYKHALETCH